MHRRQESIPTLVRNPLEIINLLQNHSENLPGIDRPEEVIAGLTQIPKSLPPKYFYDDRGSQLFEEICELPEYYPTRTESVILRQYAREMAETLGEIQLVELGSGSSTKTRILFDAYQNLGYALEYVPVDVSRSILETSARQLLENYPWLQIRGLISTYEQAFAYLPPLHSRSRGMVFLGSTLGNLFPPECDRFFQQMTGVLAAGDFLLLGVDLQKPIDILEAAYNDSQGVTAAFNLNMLAHLNWKFQGNFNLNLFRHEATYNPLESRIEMRLHCQQDCTVRLEKLDLTVDFQAGETILTEISRKFNLDQLKAQLHAHGMPIRKIWTDANQWFAVILAQVSNNES